MEVQNHNAEKIQTVLLSVTKKEYHSLDSIRRRFYVM